DAVGIFVAKFPRASPRIGYAEAVWGRALLREKRYAEAEKQLAAGYRILADQAHPQADQLEEARQDLAAVYDALKQPERAAKLRADRSWRP
ncbi:MAG: hypothetical protein ABSC93_33350, partial [Bryobacteraceae bacterium]